MKEDNTNPYINGSSKSTIQTKDSSTVIIGSGNKENHRNSSTTTSSSTPVGTDTSAIKESTAATSACLSNIDPPTDANDETGATSLLARLQDDRSDHPAPSDPNTKDNKPKKKCLNDWLRSKRMPCLVVQRILDESRTTNTPPDGKTTNQCEWLDDPSAAVLQQASRIQQQRLMDAFQKSSTSTPLRQLQEVAVTNRLIQLLLLTMVLRENPKPNITGEATSTTSSNVRTTCSLSLIQALGQQVVAWSTTCSTKATDKQSPEEEEHAVHFLSTDDWEALQQADLESLSPSIAADAININIGSQEQQQATSSIVVSFVVTTMLRLQSHVLLLQQKQEAGGLPSTSTTAIWIALWKHILGPLLGERRPNSGRGVGALLHRSLAEKALHLLSHYLEEGSQHVVVSLADHCVTAASTDASSSGTTATFDSSLVSSLLFSIQLLSFVFTRWQPLWQQHQEEDPDKDVEGSAPKNMIISASCYETLWQVAGLESTWSNKRLLGVQDKRYSQSVDNTPDAPQLQAKLKALSRLAHSAIVQHLQLQVTVTDQERSPSASSPHQHQDCLWKSMFLPGNTEEEKTTAATDDDGTKDKRTKSQQLFANDCAVVGRARAIQTTLLNQASSSNDGAASPSSSSSSSPHLHERAATKILSLCAVYMHAILPALAASLWWQCSVAISTSNNSSTTMSSSSTLEEDPCFLMSFLGQPLTHMVSTLERLERQLLMSAGGTPDAQDSVLQPLHRLYVRWMMVSGSGQLHPMTREFLLDLFHLKVTRAFFVLPPTPEDTSTTGRQSSSGAIAFLAFVVRLIFDPRTRASLRQFLTHLLNRILSVNGNDSISNSKMKNQKPNKAPTIASQIVRKLMEAEFKAVWKRSKNIAKNGERKHEASQSSGTGYKPMILSCPHDILSICHVLEQIGCPLDDDTSSVHGKGGGTLFREIRHLMQSINDPTGVQALVRNRIQMQQTAMLVSFAQGIFVNSTMTKTDQQHPSKMHQQLTGDMTLGQVGRQLIAMVDEWFRRATKKQKDSYWDAGSVLAVTVLRFVTAMCCATGGEMGSTACPKVEEIFHLVSLCTSKQFMKREALQRRLPRRVLFETMRLLQRVGKSAPTKCPNAVLKTVQAVFHQLLSLDDWEIVSYAVSSLADFGATVPETYQQVLPNCLPPHRLGLFQARVQGQIWDGQCMTKSRIDDPWQSLHSKASRRFLTDSKQEQQCLLEQCLVHEKTTAFFASSSYVIAPGSFLIEMPTQDSRKAIVIFPPGAQSWEDIHHMYDLQDENNLPPIRSIRRIITVGGRSGKARCLLEDRKTHNEE